jgi:hypothetical protein
MGRKVILYGASKQRRGGSVVDRSGLAWHKIQWCTHHSAARLTKHTQHFSMSVSNPAIRLSLAATHCLRWLKALMSQKNMQVVNEERLGISWSKWWVASFPSMSIRNTVWARKYRWPLQAMTSETLQQPPKTPHTKRNPEQPTLNHEFEHDGPGYDSWGHLLAWQHPWCEWFVTVRWHDAMNGVGCLNDGGGWQRRIIKDGG